MGFLHDRALVVDLLDRKEHSQKHAKPKDAGAVPDVGSSTGSGREVHAAGSGIEATAASTSSGDEAFAVGRVDP